MSVNVVDIAGVIRALVAIGPLPGSRLAGSLKSQFPEWNPGNFGVRSLREFVSTHVPGVVEAGRSGMDVIYALEGTNVDAPGVPSAAPEHRDFWRIWVSPNSPYAIAVDRTQLTMRAVSRAARAESGSFVIASPGSEVHRSFARDFLASVSPELRTRLDTAVGSTSEQWWQEWNEALAETELIEAWNRFRHEKFQERLAERLRVEELDQSAVETILATIRRQRTAARAAAQPRGDRSVGGMQERDRDELVQIATGAVQRMSAAELRELRLPVLSQLV